MLVIITDLERCCKFLMEKRADMDNTDTTFESTNMQ